MRSPFQPLPADLTRGHTESVGNSIRHVEQASPERHRLARTTSSILEFDLAAALDRPREALHGAIKEALKRYDELVRNSSRRLGRGVLDGAGVVSTAALRIEQKLSERTHEVATGMKDDMVLQLLRASLPLVRQALNRQIFVMYHKQMGLPLGQGIAPDAPPAAYELHVAELHGISRPADIDTIISSLSIQMEGVNMINPDLHAVSSSDAEKAAHANREEPVIDFEVSDASVKLSIDPKITSFFCRGRHCWTPSFRLTCRKLDILAKVRLWLHMRSGVLWCAFQEEPSITYDGDVQVMAGSMALPLGHRLSTKFVPWLWQKLIRKNNVTDPIKFPLRVPVLTGNANIDPRDIKPATVEDVHAVFSQLNKQGTSDLAALETCLQDNRFML